MRSRYILPPSALLLAVTLGACGAGHVSTGASRPAGAAGIPPSLEREARPIGIGPRFHPPVRGPVLGRCRRRLGPRFAVHVELFAADRVVVFAAGVGVRGPVRRLAGRISAASCFGEAVTLEPTGVVLVRPGRRLTLATLFRGWGQPLSSRRAASFAAPPGGRVRSFVAGHRWNGAPERIPLTRHAEIVVEVGPPVPPHRVYTFPPGV